MRLFVYIFIAVALLANPSYGGKHLFILAGQSNVERMDEERSFVPLVEKAFGAEQVWVVKDAYDGQPIQRWVYQWPFEEGDLEREQSGDLYTRLIRKIKQGGNLDAAETVSVIWMQGESDRALTHARRYAHAFDLLKAQMEQDLGRKDIRWVIGRLSDYRIEDPKRDGWRLVRATQEAIADADPYAVWVDTDDLNDRTTFLRRKYNDLHYTKKGYHILGERFAAAAIGLIKNRKAL